jgi:hypothetical protein
MEGEQELLAQHYLAPYHDLTIAPAGGAVSRILNRVAAERVWLERALRRTNMDRELKQAIPRPPQAVEKRYGVAG